MNKLIIDSKIEIVEINKKEDTFFITENKVHLQNEGRKQGF